MHYRVTMDNRSLMEESSPFFRLPFQTDVPAAPKKDAQ